MSGNGAFAKANGILSVEEALMAAAEANKRMIKIWASEWTLPTDIADRQAEEELSEVVALSQMATSLAAYAEALVKVRGT